MKISNFTGEYAYLSNFYMAPIEYEGIIYPSTEHAYQAAKTLDPEIRKQCLTLTAGQAKRWGRNLTIRSDWELIKAKVMTDVVRTKFQTHEDIRKKLESTYPDELVEGNTWGDTFWGVCNGKGKNVLGEILMFIRFESLWLIKITQE